MIKLIKLSSVENQDWREVLIEKIEDLDIEDIELDCNNLLLNCDDIKEINSLCYKSRKRIINIKSTVPETIVSAKSLFFKSELYLKSNLKQNINSGSKRKHSSEEITFHQGTVRSGENIHCQGHLFLVGDVNPGGIVRANGDVMIWGRLLGIAHAGLSGNNTAKISALQLMPVQLRIANKVARGPQQKPEPGLAEQAKITSGLIVISPLTSYK